MDYRMDFHKDAISLFNDDPESLLFYDVLFKIIDALDLKSKIGGFTVTDSIKDSVLAYCSRMSRFTNMPILKTNPHSKKLKRITTSFVERNKNGRVEIVFNEKFLEEHYGKQDELRSRRTPFAISSCELLILHELAHIKFMSHKRRFHHAFKNILIKWIKSHSEFIDVSKKSIIKNNKELIQVIYDSKRFYNRKNRKRR